MKSKGTRDRGSQASAASRDAHAWGISAILVIGMVVAAIGGFVFVSQFLTAPSSPTVATGPERRTLGSGAAPVSVVVYSDFQ